MQLTSFETHRVFQVKELHGSAEQLYREKIRMEADKEVEEESIVNRLQRQIEGLIQNYKVLHLASLGKVVDQGCLLEYIS